MRREEGREVKLFLVFLPLALAGFCVPLYKQINPKGLRLYILWLVFISILWLGLIWGAYLCG